MDTTTPTTQAETDVRAFAAQFPTPAVREAIRHCEAGRLTWQAVADLFARSLAKGLDEVRS